MRPVRRSPQGKGGKAPKQITLDQDATDDPLHGDYASQLFRGYYGGYCYLPLYVFCGRHLLVAKLRRIKIAMTSGCPYAHEFGLAHAFLAAAVR